MLKFIIPAIIVFLIVLFWEKINEEIYKRLNIKINYLNESLNINNNSLIAKSYLGIIYLQDPSTKNEGLQLLENILSSNKLSKEDRELIERLLLRYEN